MSKAWPPIPTLYWPGTLISLSRWLTSRADRAKVPFEERRADGHHARLVLALDAGGPGLDLDRRHVAQGYQAAAGRDQREMAQILQALAVLGAQNDADVVFVAAQAQPGGHRTLIGRADGRSDLRRRDAAHGRLFAVDVQLDLGRALLQRGLDLAGARDGGDDLLDLLRIDPPAPADPDR